jgi:hypothetical protein
VVELVRELAGHFGDTPAGWVSDRASFDDRILDALFEMNRVLCRMSIRAERVETGRSKTPEPIAAWRVRSESVALVARILAPAVPRDRRRGSTTTTVRVAGVADRRRRSQTRRPAGHAAAR